MANHMSPDLPSGNPAISPAPQRAVLLDSVANFRDYGGYRCAGGRLRSRLLFRSGHQAGASNADLRRLGQLGLAQIIDLRGAVERSRAPALDSATAGAAVLFVDDDTSGLAPHLEAAVSAAKGSLDVPGARSAMIATYATMPFRAGLQRSLRLYFQALATRDGPSLVHCAAGKDRTGLAVALLHTVLGVHRDDLVEDYLLTNALTLSDAQVRRHRATIRAHYGSDLSDAAAAAVMGVDAAYLQAAFAAIVAEHGSIAAYLAAELGVDAPVRDHLVHRLVE